MDKIFIAKILLGTSLVLGTGTAVYKYYPSSEEKALSQMISKFSDLKRFDYEGEIAMTTNMGNISGTFTGTSDISDLNNLKSALILNILTNMLGQNLNINLETRNIANISYVKLNKAPNLGFLDLSKFTNEWIKLDTVALSKQVADSQQKIKVANALTEEQIEELKNLVSNSDIFQITEKLSDEEIYGAISAHHKFEINKEELKAISLKASEIISNKKFTSTEIESLNKTFDMLGQITGEIWIGKEDNLPHKITLNAAIADNQNTKISGNMNMALTFKSFDSLINIETPPNPKELDTESILAGKFILK